MPRRRYTEQQFRTAVADPDTTTMADLCRALGLVPRGANYETVRAFARHHGISLNGLRMLTRDAVGDADFARALTTSQSYPELCRKLGMSSHTGTHRRIDARARGLGLPVPDEWSRPGARTSTPPDRLLAEEQLRPAVLASWSMTGVARELGHKPTPAVLARVRHSVRLHRIDTTHFGSPGRRLGHEARALFAKLDVDTRLNSHKLGRQLVELGLKSRACQRCGRSRWQDVPIPLELDHVNGLRSDNRFRNLRLLCPNCHALTPTYRGRNIGRTDRPEPPSSTGDHEPDVHQCRLW